MLSNVYAYIVVTAIVTYLIRVLPLTVIRCEFTNKNLRAFLYYVPYVTLAVMTFPAIIDGSCGTVTALVAFASAVALAWFGGSLFQVAGLCCGVAYVLQLLLG